MGSPIPLIQAQEPHSQPTQILYIVWFSPSFFPLTTFTNLKMTCDHSDVSEDSEWTSNAVPCGAALPGVSWQSLDTVCGHLLPGTAK